MNPSNQTEPQFSTNLYFRKRWDAVGKALAFSATDKEGWKSWREAITQKLRELIGYDTMIRSELNPTITEEIVFDDYIRQRVEIQTEPHVIMPMYVLIPKQGKSPFPVMIAPHGHSSGGKYAVAGRRDIPEVADTIEKYNYDYGVQFVREGFITFCPDARGFGERREKPEQDTILKSSCQWLNHMAYPLGQTVTGMWAWDIHRILDYIETRSECDKDIIGCAGLSGGGMQTLWATALDPRIKAAVISGYMYGYKEALLDMYTNCSCNYVPHLYEYVDMGDIAALIAPRPLYIETGNRDALNGASNVENVVSQIDLIKQAYRLYDAEDQVKHEVFEGGHQWYGVNSVPFMRAVLQQGRNV